MLPDWIDNMKFILISYALANLQPIYADQTTCEQAMNALRSVPQYEDAVCIPMPEGSVRENERTEVFSQFFDLVEKLSNGN